MTHEERMDLFKLNLDMSVLTQETYEFFPEWLKFNLPDLYEQEEQEEKMAWCKFFNPCGAATWWVMEYDRRDTFFGYADMGCPEYGYISLSELRDIKVMGGIMSIERDRMFHPTPMSEIVKLHSQRGM